jgi:hypothetical protein
MIADELHLAFAEAVAVDLGTPDNHRTTGNGNGEVVCACAWARPCSNGPGAGAADAPRGTHREVDSKGALDFKAELNKDMLSGKGELHAACAGRGSINCPGPLLADAAGGPRSEKAGGDISCRAPVPKTGRLDASGSAAHPAESTLQKGGAGHLVLPARPHARRLRLQAGRFFEGNGLVTPPSGNT